MNTPSLETLLEKLADGDSEAAERVFGIMSRSCARWSAGD